MIENNSAIKDLSQSAQKFISDLYKKNKAQIEKGNYVITVFFETAKGQDDSDGSYFDFTEAVIRGLAKRKSGFETKISKRFDYEGKKFKDKDHEILYGKNVKAEKRKTWVDPKVIVKESKMDIKSTIKELAENMLTEAVEVSHDRYLRSHGKKFRASPHSTAFMFTHKNMGDVDYSDDKEVFRFTGKYPDAKKAAQKWAKGLGHREIFIMEEVELDEVSMSLAKKVQKARDAKGDEFRTKAGIHGTDTASGNHAMNMANKNWDKADKTKAIISKKMREEVEELSEDVHNDLNDAIIEFQKKLMRMTRKLDPAIAKEVKAIDKALDDLRQGPLFKVRPGR
jgi:hypothetical protein